MTAAQPIGKVAIVGGGIMGSGIAEVCARVGLSTLCH
jgi:3-hydroxyacyl-CoA dehydrogenase